MLTYLPHASYELSARALSDKHLHSAHSSALWVWDALQPDYAKYGIETSDIDKPVVVMWCGFEASLAEYGKQLATELSRRTLQTHLVDLWEALFECAPDSSFTEDATAAAPWWLGGSIHRSHQSQLLKLDYAAYCDSFSKDVPIGLPLFWPEVGPQRHRRRQQLQMPAKTGLIA